MARSRMSIPASGVRAAATCVFFAAAVAASPAAAQGTPPQPPSVPAEAPRPAVPGTFGFGHPASADDIARINIDVRADGMGLPAGSGTAGQGAAIFAQKCTGCHGANGEGTSAGPKLIDPTPFRTGVTAPTVGNYWPYATTIWDYVNRAMPFDRPGSLTADEVYALTAYLLAQNEVIADAEVMTAQTLPQVKMPNADGFRSPDPRPDVP